LLDLTFWSYYRTYNTCIIFWPLTVCLRCLQLLLLIAAIFTHKILEIIMFTKLSLTRYWTYGMKLAVIVIILFACCIRCQLYFLYFAWSIIEDRPRSPDKGRLRWGNVGLNSQTAPRKWKSMLDVTGEKSAGAAKLSCPKTPPAVFADKRIVASNRTNSPSPLRYGIGVLSQCFVMLPVACWYGVGGLRYTM